MHLGTVIGRVVATRKVEGLEGVKLLLVRPEDERGRPKGAPLVMADGAGPSGPGDRVWWIEGREGTLALPEDFVPVDAAIVAVVDSVDVDAAVERGGDGATDAAAGSGPAAPVESA
jgi:ethanolamine utilization protein EutN